MAMAGMNHQTSDHPMLTMAMAGIKRGWMQQIKCSPKEFATWTVELLFSPSRIWKQSSGEITDSQSTQGMMAVDWGHGRSWTPAWPHIPYPHGDDMSCLQINGLGLKFPCYFPYGFSASSSDRLLDSLDSPLPRSRRDSNGACHFLCVVFFGNVWDQISRFFGSIIWARFFSWFLRILVCS